MCPHLAPTLSVRGKAACLPFPTDRLLETWKGVSFLHLRVCYEPLCWTLQALYPEIQLEMLIPFYFNKMIRDISFISLLSFVSDLNTTTTTPKNIKFPESIADDGCLWRGITWIVRI